MPNLNNRQKVAGSGRAFTQDFSRVKINASFDRYNLISSLAGRAGAATRKGLDDEAARFAEASRLLFRKLEAFHLSMAQEMQKRLVEEAYRGTKNNKYGRVPTRALGKAISNSKNIAYSPSGFQVMRLAYLNSLTGSGGDRGVKDYWDIVDRGTSKDYVTDGFWLQTRGRSASRTLSRIQRTTKSGVAYKALNADGRPLVRTSEAWVARSRGERLFQSRNPNAKGNWKIKVSKIEPKYYIANAALRFRGGKKAEKIYEIEMQNLAEEFVEYGLDTSNRLTRLTYTLNYDELPSGKPAPGAGAGDKIRQIKREKKGERDRERNDSRRKRREKEKKPEDILDVAESSSGSDELKARVRRRAESEVLSQFGGDASKYGKRDNKKYSNKKFWDDLPPGLAKEEQRRQALEREIQAKLEQLQEEALSSAKLPPDLEEARRQRAAAARRSKGRNS